MRKVNRQSFAGSGPIVNRQYLDSLYFYRGNYNSRIWKEFFAPDIIGKYAVSYNDNGLSYFKKGNYSLAEREFKKAISLKFDYPLAYYNLGITNFYKDSFKEAEKNYLFAIKYYERDMKRKELVKYISPEKAKVHNNLGALYEKQSKFSRAIGEYERAIELDPNFDEPHYNLGVVYWKQNKWKDVVREFEETLRLNPNHLNARRFLVQAKMRLNKDR